MSTEELPTPPVLPTGIDPEEKDTDEQETLCPIEFMKLMLPENNDSQQLPLNFSRFSMSYSTPAFQGWVKQPSPSCAAASVAGAFNLLNRVDRSDSLALNLYDILSYYETMVQQRIQKRKESIERILGQSIDPLDEKLGLLLQEKGVEFGGKNVKRKIVLSTILEILKDEENTADVFNELRDITKEPSAPSAEIEEGEADGAEEANEENIQLENAVAWDWKAKLYDYYHNIDGLAKLRRPKPSTGMLGNWALIQSIRDISEKRKWSFTASYLFGKKVKGVKIRIPVSLRDTETTIDSQWAELTNIFNRSDSAIIYHLKNHYALIFALREYVSSEGNSIRQVLTARKGQRPTAWIDFQHVRETVLKWAGYRMLWIRKL